MGEETPVRCVRDIPNGFTMNIAMLGASGETGRECVAQGVAYGHFVTAFVRNPSRVSLVQHHLKVIEGDVVGYPEVEGAVKGRDAVLSALGAKSSCTYDHSVGERLSNIIKAMEPTKMNRLIYMSAVNVPESRSNAGLLIQIVASVLLWRETIIRRSDLEWTLVHPGVLGSGGRNATYWS